MAPTHHDATFLYNPYQPNEIYYHDIHSGELFNFELKSPDNEWFEYTIPDYLSAMQQDAVYNHFANDVKQQQHVTFENNLETNIDAIDNKYAEAVEKSPPISKSRISREKKKNRKDERSLMSFIKTNSNEKIQNEMRPEKETYTRGPNIQISGQNILDSLILGGLK